VRRASAGGGARFCVRDPPQWCRVAAERLIRLSCFPPRSNSRRSPVPLAKVGVDWTQTCHQWQPAQGASREPRPRIADT